MEIGEWKKVKIGHATVVGYVSRIGYYHSQIELVIVGRIKNGIMQWECQRGYYLRSIV